MSSTTCEKCIFAEWDWEEQMGCRFGRIGKFFDQGKARKVGNHYEIDRLCNTCTKGDIGEYTLDEAQKIVRENIQAKVDFIIIVNDKSNLQNSLNNIKKQTIKPKHVYYIVQGNVPYKNLFLNIIKELNQIEVKCSVVSVYNDLCVNEGIRKCKNQFYSIFDDRDEIPEYFVERIDYFLNEELLQFLCITGERLSGTTFLTRVNQLFAYDTPIQERVDYLKEQIPGMVLEWK